MKPATFAACSTLTWFTLIQPSYGWAAASIEREMSAVLAPYFAAAADLAADRADRLPAHFVALASATKKAHRAAQKLRGKGARTGAREVVALAAALEAHRTTLRLADLGAVRRVFFSLSKPLIRYASRFPAAKNRHLVIHCPHALAAWLQPASSPRIANPYFGKKMLRCGERVRLRGEPPA